MVRLALATLSAAVFSVASAHFQLNYPASRGFNEDIEATAPCGGFNTPSTRTEFPLRNGFVEISSGHPSYTYTVKVIGNSNPSTADFAGNNATVVAQGSRSFPGASCLPLDLANAANIVAGTNATLQVLFEGGDGVLYQCTDVTFAENPSSFNSSTCVNADGSSPSNSPSSNDQHSGTSTVLVKGSLLAAAVAGTLAIIAF